MEEQIRTDVPVHGVQVYPTVTVVVPGSDAARHRVYLAEHGLGQTVLVDEAGLGGDVREVPGERRRGYHVSAAGEDRAQCHCGGLQPREVPSPSQRLPQPRNRRRQRVAGRADCGISLSARNGGGTRNATCPSPSGQTPRGLRAA